MKQGIKDAWKVFLTAFVQVFLIAFQTKSIQNDHVIFVGLAAFGISLCWLNNVNNVMATRAGKIGYVLGATFGSMTSVILYKMWS
jgi:Ca2+/H+ antiporter